MGCTQGTGVLSGPLGCTEGTGAVRPLDEAAEDILETPGFVCNAIAPGIDYQELAAAQNADPDVQAI